MKQAANLLKDFIVQLGRDLERTGTRNGREILVTQLELKGAGPQAVFPKPASYHPREPRERGFDRIDSFPYSALASTIYEFGVEAIFERPSYQDLLATPIGGALIGGFVFEPIRNWIKRKPELKWYDHVGLIATDPIGALNYLAERLLGIKSDIRVGIPRGGGVFDELARLDMTGAAIVESARTAALLAAKEAKPGERATVELRHVAYAVKRQYRRETRLLSSRELKLLGEET